MSKIYKLVISSVDRFVPSKLRPLWEHDAGPKTVFFWAPAFKWIPKYQYLITNTFILIGCEALVGASVDNYRRPVETISMSQSASLAATGFIWTRYCLVIKPINYSLSICNFMLGIANGVQCFLAYNHQRKLKLEA